MIPPDFDDISLPDWARDLPRPALSAAARARSLNAARAAIPVPRRRWRPSLNSSAMAACWIAILVLKWINPSLPQRPDDGVRTMAYQPHLDAETATLLAGAYLHQTQETLNWPPGYHYHF